MHTRHFGTTNKTQSHHQFKDGHKTPAGRQSNITGADKKPMSSADPANMMPTDRLDYTYPDELVATQPTDDYRILLGGPHPTEISKATLFKLLQPGDLLIINDTRVEKRRVTNSDGLEVLFLEPLESEAEVGSVFHSEFDIETLAAATTQASSEAKAEPQAGKAESPQGNGHQKWRVLFPASQVEDGVSIALPGDMKMKLFQRGLPQVVELSQKLTPEYFEKYGELALPPYIQKARGRRRVMPEDETWYQTDWARVSGSQAAPTASLHFSNADLSTLWARGVQILPITLHVGMGTFLPVKTENLEDHVMHSEPVHIPAETATQIISAKREGKKVWALGTTAMRALESWARGMLVESSDGSSSGATSLFIRSGFQFEVVDGLLTNFHQPRSTLLALVCAFAGYQQVMAAYQYAVEKKFRLFSYGDLTVWRKP